MGCGMRNLCRRRGRDEDEVSSAELSLAASSHGLVKEECAGAGLGLRPCMNCILIEMGEMVCYTERCPDCGRVPPGRRQHRAPAPGQGVGRGLRRLLQQSRRQHKQGYVSRQLPFLLLN